MAEINNLKVIDSETGEAVTYEITDPLHDEMSALINHDPVIELKNSIVDYDETGYNAETLSETLNSGTENHIYTRYLAKKQVTGIEANAAGNGLEVTTVNQSGAVQTQEIELPGLDTDALATRVSANETSISSLNTRVTNLQSAQTSQASDITSLQSEQTEQAEDIATLQTDVSTAQSDITELQSKVSTHNTAIADQAEEIATANGNISTNTNDITQLKSDVSTNTSDIQNLIKDITAETTITPTTSVSTLTLDSVHVIFDKFAIFTFHMIQTDSVAAGDSLFLGTISNSSYNFLNASGSAAFRRTTVAVAIITSGNTLSIRQCVSTVPVAEDLYNFILICPVATK